MASFADLPLELQLLILEKSDLKTPWAVRRVSKEVKAVAESGLCVENAIDRHNTHDPADSAQITRNLDQQISLLKHHTLGRPYSLIRHISVIPSANPYLQGRPILKGDHLAYARDAHTYDIMSVKGRTVTLQNNAWNNAMALGESLFVLAGEKLHFYWLRNLRHQGTMDVDIDEVITGVATNEDYILMSKWSHVLLRTDLYLINARANEGRDLGWISTTSEDTDHHRLILDVKQRVCHAITDLQGADLLAIDRVDFEGNRSRVIIPRPYDVDAVDLRQSLTPAGRNDWLLTWCDQQHLLCFDEHGVTYTPLGQTSLARTVWKGVAYTKTYKSPHGSCIAARPCEQSTVPEMGEIKARPTFPATGNGNQELQHDHSQLLVNESYLVDYTPNMDGMAAGLSIYTFDMAVHDKRYAKRTPESVLFSDETTDIRTVARDPQEAALAEPALRFEWVPWQ